ncbi:piggyBac transposable element-derived protein 4-like [Anoplophora glabripennis]|uniref:piggyBac transposable element-derived protein 4-like n=1 Tax=Anoplophora glabripennis TaxID=217634 RepID=UPI000874066F|nr:piggyBac transposable element-derived protein 4-like [Anoplophora glabripennis]
MACWKLSDNENMDPGRVFDLLDEIPSDNESLVEDLDEVMNDELPTPDASNNGEVFDIENMDIIIEDNDMISNNDLHWDSDDDIPLARRPDIFLPDYWSDDVSNIMKPSAFAEATGPDLPDDIETTTNVFLHLFPEDLITHITFQTNLYAFQRHGEGRNFKPTTAKEIKIFLGVNLLMGLKKPPSFKDYWSSQEEMRDPFISSVISRDRFAWLLSNIHLNDNAVQPQKGEQNYDKLYKVRPLLSKLQETFMSSMKPSEFQSVDESMIRFKGRSSFRQYMPMKPIKRGYKVWVRADSTGYMCEFQIYTGKADQVTEKNLGHRVVMDLTRKLVDKNHKVFFDNYFNSVQLQRKLQSDKIHSCGTIRKGRKHFPELKTDKAMKRGEADWRVSNDGIAALKWMDRRSVLLLGNYHDPSIMETTSRKKKNGCAEEIPCPRMIRDYNTHMGYVDRFDMMKSHYEVDRKAHKWWHRIIFYFLDATIVNAFILFQQRCDCKTLTLKQFRMSVLRGLIGIVEPAKSGRPSLERPPSNFKKVVPYENDLEMYDLSSGAMPK